MYKCKLHYVPVHHVHVYECMYLVQNIIHPYKAFCGQVQNVHSNLSSLFQMSDNLFC